MSDKKESFKKTKNPKQMEKFIKFGQPVDCKFLVGPDVKCANVIEGHKFIFAAASSVFERMLFGEFKETMNPFEIRIPEDHPKTFNNLRYLLYDFDALKTMSILELLSLYRICHKYLMEDQTASITDELKLRSKGIPSNEINIVVSLAMDYQLMDLLSHLWKRLTHLSWPSDNINVLKPNQFITYLWKWRYLHYGNFESLTEKLNSYLEAKDMIPNNFFASIPENEVEKKKHRFIETILLDHWNLQHNTKGNFAEFRRILFSKYGY
uniref:BTB domain-containing protein n=1 Tax=Haematobia irritans TaxID=7368 RepID=A0A1L8ECP4_HAEIR